MSIIRYNSSDFVPVSFRNLMDPFFNNPMSCTPSDVFIPNADTIENDDSFTIQIETPGMKKDDFKVEIDDQHLTVSGDRKFKSENEEKDFRSIETRYGSFSRSFALPEEVEANQVKAHYSNGILELIIPKSEKKEAKRISVKVS